MSTENVFALWKASNIINEKFKLKSKIKLGIKSQKYLI